ncbi:hypothetical protein BH09PSE5_BH09PSE5_45760 [soil metagenome]
MSTTWHTAWQNQDVVVYKGGDNEVDRLPGQDIKRVIFVYQGRGESPGDLLYAVAELPDDWVLFPADTGFAGRVNFERQKFWEERACVYWVNEAHAKLPGKFRRSRWFVPSTVPPFARIPRVELASFVDAWPIEGPHTWEQRKWMRIQRGRAFTSSNESTPPPKLRA